MSHENIVLVRKQHDLANSVDLVLMDTSIPVDLSNAVEVRFIIDDGEGTAKVNAVMTVHPDQSEQGGTRGVVTYMLEPEATNQTGSWEAEVQVMWAGSRPQTFPEDGYISWVVVRDLG